MNQKLLAEFRDVNAKPRVVIDYREVKGLEKLRKVTERAFLVGCNKYYWFEADESDTPPDFPHRLVTVEDFFREEEWTPKSGEEVDVYYDCVWKKGIYIESRKSRHLVKVGERNIWAFHLKKIEQLPKILEEVEVGCNHPNWNGKWMRGFYMGYLNGHHYVATMDGRAFTGYDVRPIKPIPPIPTISIEEAEEKLKSFGVEVKIKN